MQEGRMTAHMKDNRLACVKKYFKKFYSILSRDYDVINIRVFGNYFVVNPCKDKIFCGTNKLVCLLYTSPSPRD